MRALTAAELEVINNSTKVLDKTVLLGDYLQSAIGEFNTSFTNALGVVGTPRNAASATATLTLMGVVLDGESISVGHDTYEFAADLAQTVGFGNIPVNIRAHTVAAVGTLTMATQPIAGDKVTIGTKVFTFVPIGTDTADGEVSVGLNAAAAQANLVAAINGTDEISNPHPLVSASAFAANICTITAIIGGAAGNVIATTETLTAAGNIFAAGTLLTGANCTAANAILDLVAAVTASGTEEVTAVDGLGDTVVFTAASGLDGNSILVSKVMANASWGVDVVALSGGLDQTAPAGARFMIDADALYVFVTDTWYKLVLGTL